MEINSPNRLVVFDCDGTLVDSQFNIIHAMTVAFEECDIVPPSDMLVRGVIGLNLDEAIKRLAANNCSEETQVRLVKAYKEAFFQNRQQDDHDEPLYHGTVDLLKDLERANIAMAVATGKSMRGLKAVIANHNLDRYFSSLQTPDHNPGKPHPQMLEKAMAVAGVEPMNTYMLGDTSFDMELAKNASCIAVGVSWGYHDKAELLTHGAEHFIDDYDEFRKILNLS